MMPRLSFTVMNQLCTLLILLCYLNTVECLKCLQCSSLFDHGCLDGSVEPIPCVNASDIYCLKYETVDDNVKFVNRDCASEEVFGCYDMVLDGGKTVKVCRSTCMEDACNAASIIYTRCSLCDIFLFLISAISASYVIDL